MDDIKFVSQIIRSKPISKNYNNNSIFQVYQKHGVPVSIKMSGLYDPIRGIKNEDYFK